MTQTRGIKFTVIPEEIDKLNLLVQNKVEQFVAKSNKSGSLSPEIEAVISGRKVYKRRLTWLPITLFFYSLYLIIQNVDSIATLIITGLIQFIWYDFFSGILHIILDNPEFINFPLIGPACLEFQWHHHIPLDLASKSFLETCGDLNLVMTLLLAFYSFPFIGFNYTNKTAFCLIGFKVLMAYFGQLCHCMSHTPKHHRPHWVIFLQDKGLMISSKDHMKHHQTYDDNFCIGSGICNPFLSWLLKKLPSNKYFWLILFGVSLFADIPFFYYLLTVFGGFK